MIKSLIKSIPGVKFAEEQIARFVPSIYGMPSYSSDGMFLFGKNIESLKEGRFLKAYKAGVNSGHKLSGDKKQSDIHIEWRVHMALWAATHGILLEGDFVECGVNTGILSLAICDYLDFGNKNKKFYLFDTFAGIPEHQMSATEREARLKENEMLYEDCYTIAARNFKPYSNVHLIKGEVPSTLENVRIDKVSYLSIDMNIAAPEVAALEYFWPKLTTGAIVLFDDYGWINYREQKTALDSFANKHHVSIATLPTGQGLLIKP
jgi:O-methyltransferase